MALQTVGGVSLTNVLVEAAGYFSEMINQRMIQRSFWASLVERDSWPDGESDTLSILTYERTLPNGPQLWSPVNSNSGSTNFAIPSATQIGVAQTIRQYGLVHTAVESIPITVNDARFSFRTQQQMKAVFNNLTANVQRIWEIRIRDEYRRLCGTKYVVGYQNSGTQKLYATTGADYPTDVTPAGVGPLTQAFLERIRAPLINDGAAEEPMGKVNGRTVFTVVAGADALDNLMRIDPSLREDIRQSSQVDELLKPWGAERTIRGFAHIADDMAPRYNYVEGVQAGLTATITSLTVSNFDAATGVGTLTLVTTGSNFSTFRAGMNFEVGTQIVRAKVISVTSNTVLVFQAASVPGGNTTVTGTNFKIRNRDWTADMAEGFHEVPFYIPGSADPANVSLDLANGTNHGRATGTRWVPNPAYADAEYEEGFIFHKKVFKLVIPNPYTSAGSGVNFAPKSYTGAFSFLNEYHRVENPDKSWGYFRGLLASGSMPVSPYWGVAFIYKRFETPGAVIGVPTWDTLSTARGLVAGAEAATGSGQDGLPVA
jgi:hypothetical protein